MNNIIIIGGGLTGLSCAFKLIQMEILPSNIEIFEGRQEIGSPTRSPGIANNSKNIETLFNQIKLQPLTLLNFENDIFTFRREWLEKSISIYLTKLGCKINLKTTITEGKIKEIINSTKNNKIIIDCSGQKTISSGFPADYTKFINNEYPIINIEKRKLIEWYGYLSVNNKETKITNNYISINKKDGLNEIWTNNKVKLNYKFIEMFKSKFPHNVKDILANNTIDRGFLLANKAMQRV